MGEYALGQKLGTCESLYTIGHGKHPLKDFFETLTAHEIKVLIDVRSYPASKRAPQYNRANLEKECSKHKIEYHWRGKSLGGLGEVEHAFFMKGVAELRAYADLKAAAIMCSETDYKKCHRHQKIELLKKAEA